MRAGDWIKPRLTLDADAEPAGWPGQAPSPSVCTSAGRVLEGRLKASCV